MQIPGIPVVVFPQKRSVFHTALPENILCFTFRVFLSRKEEHVYYEVLVLDPTQVHSWHLLYSQSSLFLLIFLLQAQYMRNFLILLSLLVWYLCGHRNLLMGCVLFLFWTRVTIVAIFFVCFYFLLLLELFL